MISEAYMQLPRLRPAAVAVVTRVMGVLYKRVALNWVAHADLRAAALLDVQDVVAPGPLRVDELAEDIRQAVWVVRAEAQ